MRFDHDWTPADLAPVLDGLRTGTISGPVPSIMTRTDGPSVLYLGQIHSLSGEPETGKSLLAQGEAAHQLKLGKHVLYADFETTAVEVMERLRALGATDEQIIENFAYVRPEVEPDADTIAELLARGPFELAIIDGVSEAFVLLGLDPYSNVDAAKFIAALPQPIADSGAAVVQLDHVVKATESRGRYALGAQHKLAGIACAFTVEAITRPNRTTAGKLKLKIVKDRHGRVRCHAVGDTIALVTITPSAGGQELTVTVDPPDSTTADGAFRPTVLMARISRFLAEHPGATTNAIRSSGGNSDALKTGLEILIAEGYVEMKPDGQARRHHNLKAYTGDDETTKRNHRDQTETNRNHGPETTGTNPLQGGPGHGPGSGHHRNGHANVDDDQLQDHLEAITARNRDLLTEATPMTVQPPRPAPRAATGAQTREVRDERRL